MNREPHFSHRGWGIRVWNNPDEFDEAVRRAVVEAPAHEITTLDLHDGTIPPGIGWVDLFAEYRQVHALRGRTVLTYHGHEVTHEQRVEHRTRFRQLCRLVKESGLRLHVWYHVLRDLPEEWLESEPTLSRLEGRRLWQVVGSMLDDFLNAVPEVDALTVTAHQAVATGMRDSSSVTPGERLRAIYQCVYEACRRHRRQFIIREIGYTPSERDTFLYAVGPLPPDIPIMVKDVQGDWNHLAAPPNPILRRLSGKNVILETDLYGEHWGRLEVPICRLQEVHRTVRSWLDENVIGGIGRIMVREQDHGPMLHIFDTPNAANVATFSRLLKAPGPRLEDAGAWDASLEEFDLGLWLDWIRQDYGDQASPFLVAALYRTPQICQFTFYLGGAYFQHASFLPDPTMFERQMWPTFKRQAEKLGVSVLRWEKDEALRLVRQSLRDLELAGPTLEPAHYERLLAHFEQSRDVILAYRSLINLCDARLNPDAMGAAVSEAYDLAARLENVRGPEFFGRLSERLRHLAQYLRDVTRAVPPRAAAPGEIPEEDRADDGTFDVSDLGVPKR